ncbi:unnamed protein product [Knipowitschia caucasica]
MRVLLGVFRCLEQRPGAFSCRKLCVANSKLAPEDESALVRGSNPRLLQQLGSQVEVRPNFITEQEEAALVKELEPGLKRKRYEFDHWDNAIHGYRATDAGGGGG